MVNSEVRGSLVLAGSLTFGYPGECLISVAGLSSLVDFCRELWCLLIFLPNL